MKWDKPPMPRDQLLLISRSLDDAVPADHLVRVIELILGTLDWSEFTSQYHERLDELEEEYRRRFEALEPRGAAAGRAWEEEQENLLPRVRQKLADVRNRLAALQKAQALDRAGPPSRGADPCGAVGRAAAAAGQKGPSWAAGPGTIDQRGVSVRHEGELLLVSAGAAALLYGADCGREALPRPAGGALSLRGRPGCLRGLSTACTVCQWPVPAAHALQRPVRSASRSAPAAHGLARMPTAPQRALHRR